MYKAIDIARYFINKDPNAIIFNNKRCGYDIEGQPYAGNLILNKLLHTAQGIYIAKFGEQLFPDALYAYTNGPVVESVRTQYFSLLRNRTKYSNLHFSDTVDHILDQVYEIFGDTPVDEYIEMSHYDSSWEEALHDKVNYQRMDMMKHKDDYKYIYSGTLYLMETIDRGAA